MKRSKMSTEGKTKPKQSETIDELITNLTRDFNESGIIFETKLEDLNNRMATVTEQIDKVIENLKLLKESNILSDLKLQKLQTENELLEFVLKTKRDDHTSEKHAETIYQTVIGALLALLLVLFVDFYTRRYGN